MEKVAPYISQYNEAYFYPALKTVSAGYEKYAQPSIQKAKFIAGKEYEEKLHPHVARVSSQLNHVYGQNLSPYTHKVYEYYRDAASSPHWTQVRGHAEGVYKVYVIPVYDKVSPYLNRVYENGRYITVMIVGPYVKEGAKAGGEWLEKHVWAGVSDIWKGYVEVQVGRIKERVNSSNE